MIMDQDEIKDQGNAVVESKQSRRHEDPVKTDSKRRKKSRKKSRDMDSHDLNSVVTLNPKFSHNQHLRQQSKDNLDLEKLMEDFCQVEAACSMMHGNDHDNGGKVHTESNQKHVISENLARDAVNELVNQMMLNGKDLPEDRKFLCSHELMEALQVISSDKELFLRLLQDPNSHVLKYIQELENAQGKGDDECSSVTGSKCCDQDLVNMKQTSEIVNRKHRNFFGRKRLTNYRSSVKFKLPVQPLQIQFEDHECSPLDQFDRGKYCHEENELIYDYIKAVFNASGLSRDQLFMKCLSTDKILDPSLFDQVEFFSNLLSHDRKLLFDCINEVLMEVCWHYFGVSPWVSFVNLSIRLTPNMKRVILKVWEVCWHVLPLPPPRTLEQIVGKDMEKRGTWVDLGQDAETLGFEIGEAILAEMMEDTILNFVSESSKSKCSLQFELKDNESSINL
ncbi:hypothetical protein RJT34_11578 [Clitoria ternatea]|uniref:DUF4378 domain-containing protein n=1 Tax=Clitoria ternatea TaxID=43366 RepID=A0AAN9JNV4_CLITE